MAAPDTLKAAYENAVNQLAAARAAYLTDGDRPNFSLDGVSVNWPAYEAFLIEQVQDLLEAWLKADQAYNGPVWLTTVGR